MLKKQEEKARAVLRELTERKLAQYAEEYAALYHVTVIEVCSDVRSAAVIRARHHAWWRIRKETLLSNVEIGFAWGGVNNSTVRHAIDEMDKRLETVGGDATESATTGGERVVWHCSSCGYLDLAMHDYKVGDTEECVFCDGTRTLVAEGAGAEKERGR